MKKSKQLFYFLLISILIIGPLFTIFAPKLNYEILPEKSSSEAFPYNNKVKSSDVAGTDLYAEQISAFVAGNKSLIRQSLFTNDTNIFTQFDVTDPAFHQCNVIISVSNGIKPQIFPSIMTNNIFGSSFALSYNSFLGFLYYDEDVSLQDAEARAERALEIIRRKFQIDLIMVETTEPNFFPFVAYYPMWDVYFGEILQNLPMDGYWQALNTARITSDSYIQKYHLSSTYLLINSLEMIEEGFNISTDQLDFSLDAIDLSYLQNINMEDLFGQINLIMEDYGGLLNFTGGASAGMFDNETLAAMEGLLGSFALSNNSHYSALIVQYEGQPNGIQESGDNRYSFNLWEAMGYYGGPLHPSEKIYIALVGAFMSEIDINILCTDIIDYTPEQVGFYDFMIEQIGFLLFLAGYEEIDVSVLEDYAMEILWVNEDGMYRNYATIVNPNNPNDFVNSLGQLGFQGFPFLPTGLLNPIDNVIISYNITTSEPNMIITKELVGGNASY